MKKIFQYMLFFSLTVLGLQATSLGQQDTKKDKKSERASMISSLITSRHFTFDARSVSPAGGATRQLTSYYDVTLKGDTLISYLPYFGRAYSPPINTSDAGINFTSKDFSYESTQRRRGGWNILIKPNDVPNAQQLSFSISENGQASLQVISNNRQTISFQGVIKENRK
jgi:hypothetical protein